MPARGALVWKELRLREAAWGPESQRVMMVVSLLLIGFLLWLPSNGVMLWPLLVFALILAILCIFNGAHLFREFLRLFSTPERKPLPVFPEQDVEIVEDPWL